MMKHARWITRLILPSLLLLSILLGGCGNWNNRRGVPIDVSNAEVTRKTMDNGDKIEEYRISGQLRMVKVTPARGAPYYLYDRNGDGHLDGDGSQISPVYWKLYSW